MRGRLNQIQQKYAPALQIDKYVKEHEEIADNLKRRAEQHKKDK
ncbi:bacteriophage-like DNA-binding-containing protein [Synechococcus sp. A15-24]|nr:bacteriophage-like DNA-binding-containing protein [Synechococcus sp. A15-24]